MQVELSEEERKGMTPEMEQKFNLYIQNAQVKLRLEAWLARNDTKSFKPPIFWDSSKQEWWWATRQQRNHMKGNHRKNNR